VIPQKPKKWHKKPKVNPLNPNKYNEHTWYQNNPWEFNTKNRDRPSGHTTSKWDKAWTSGIQKHGRHQKRFFIAEGLIDQDDVLQEPFHWEDDEPEVLNWKWYFLDHAEEDYSQGYYYPEEEEEEEPYWVSYDEYHYA
jgi:hypothetical protein